MPPGSDGKSPRGCGLPIFLSNQKHRWHLLKSPSVDGLSFITFFYSPTIFFQWNLSTISAQRQARNLPHKPRRRKPKRLGGLRGLLNHLYSDSQQNICCTFGSCLPPLPRDRNQFHSRLVERLFH